MTTNPGNPAALSHPLWLSRGSLSIRSPLFLFLTLFFLCICLSPSSFIHINDSPARSQKHSFSCSLFSFSLSLSLYSAATPIPAARLWLLRALSCARARGSIHLSRARRMYVCAILQTAARFIHLLGFCPWLLHPAIPVCEGGGLRPYATRDPRAGLSPRTTETRRRRRWRRMRKRTRRLRARGNWKHKGDEMQRACIVS